MLGAGRGDIKEGFGAEDTWTTAGGQGQNMCGPRPGVGGEQKSEATGLLRVAHWTPMKEGANNGQAHHNLNPYTPKCSQK